MTETSVVQLARFNSTDYASNTEWRTTLQNSIVLNEGDTAVISKAYLDSRLNAGGNIVIDKDIDLRLTYYFYQMFSPDGTSLQTLNGTPKVDTGTPGMPVNTPPAVPAVSTLNPNDLSLWANSFRLGPYRDANGYHTFDDGQWAQYQPGTGTTPGDLTQNPYLNDGVPVSPWDYINSPARADPTPIPTPNQCYAAEIPLLLTSVPTGAAGTPNNVDNSIPYTKEWFYTLKAGSYAPAELAELITRAMSSIQQIGQEVSSYTAYEQFGTSTTTLPLNSFLAKGQCISLINFPVGAVTLDNFNPVPPYGGNPFTTDTAWMNGMTYATNDTNNPLFPQSNYILSTFLTDAFIPRNYTTFQFEPDTNSQTNPIIFQQTHYTSGYLTQQGANFIGMTSYESPLIGCSEPELVWNDQAGVFQFTYTHTPLQELPTGGGAAGTNTGSNPIEVVKIVKTINMDIQFENPGTPYFPGRVNICEHTKHSGIIFQRMEPVEFWSGILGFDVPAITVKVEDIWGSGRTINFAKFKAVTTSGFVGLQNNFNYRNVGPAIDPSIGNLNNPPYMGPAPVYPTPGPGSKLGALQGPLTYSNLLNSGRWFAEDYLLRNPTAFGAMPQGNFPYATFFPFFYEEYASALTATNPISALRGPLSNQENVGHYLIEIIAYGKDQEMITNETVYQIKSIVSSYYQSSGSFQSQPFPDAYTYEHVGETQVIYSFKVRIIDPYTMDTAKNLGPSSSVYIQFNRALNKISLSQPDQ